MIPFGSKSNLLTFLPVISGRSLMFTSYGFPLERTCIMILISKLQELQELQVNREGFVINTFNLFLAICTYTAKSFKVVINNK